MKLRPLTAAVVLSLWLQMVLLARADERGVLFNAALGRLYLKAADEAISRHTIRERDGTTYTSTGDIPAEWLRDGSAIAHAYIDVARTDPSVAATLKGVIRRQARYILIDAYANAFTSRYTVFEEKFEVDSLLYPIWLAHDYWRTTGDGSFFDGRESLAFDRVLEVLQVEQHHSERSRYRNPKLPHHGRGSPVAYTGMVWTGFRPSDDPSRFNYNIPDNMFAVVVLRRLAEIEHEIYHDDRKAELATGLADQIRDGIERYGRVDLPDGEKIYAYEVDGLGHALLMDDANVPSLLSIPYFGYVPVQDPVYQATRSFVLSPRNPYFYRGKVAQGIGSPHTPRNYVWPLALVMQALTTSDADEIRRVLGYLAASDTGDHRLHESFDVNAPWKYTRADFAWPNALYMTLLRAVGAVSQVEVEYGKEGLVGAGQQRVDRDRRPEVVAHDRMQTKNVVQDHGEHQRGDRHDREERHPSEVAAAPREHEAAPQRVSR
jgi:meiotically up-regulated gene 157 (Mug157) protein